MSQLVTYPGNKFLPYFNNFPATQVINFNFIHFDFYLIFIKKYSARNFIHLKLPLRDKWITVLHFIVNDINLIYSQYIN